MQLEESLETMAEQWDGYSFHIRALAQVSAPPPRAPSSPVSLASPASSLRLVLSCAFLILFLGFFFSSLLLSFGAVLHALNGVGSCKGGRTLSSRGLWEVEA